jgi:hypothetical protein
VAEEVAGVEPAWARAGAGELVAPAAAADRRPTTVDLSRTAVDLAKFEFRTYSVLRKQVESQKLLSSTAIPSSFRHIN